MDKQTSDCCMADLITQTLNDGTSYWCCRKCQRACDVNNFITPDTHVYCKGFMSDCCSAGVILGKDYHHFCSKCKNECKIKQDTMDKTELNQFYGESVTNLDYESLKLADTKLNIAIDSPPPDSAQIEFPNTINTGDALPLSEIKRRINEEAQVEDRESEVCSVCHGSKQDYECSNGVTHKKAQVEECKYCSFGFPEPEVPVDGLPCNKSEGKVEVWEPEFDREFVDKLDGTVEPIFRDPNGDVGPVKQFIKSTIQKAVDAAVRERNELLQDIIDSDVDFEEWDRHDLRLRVQYFLDNPTP